MSVWHPFSWWVNQRKRNWIICLQYQHTKPFQEEEHRGFKAESVSLTTRNMPSVAPQYHFAANSLVKLSDDKLAACACHWTWASLQLMPTLEKPAYLHRAASLESCFHSDQVTKKIINLCVWEATWVPFNLTRTTGLWKQVSATRRKCFQITL